MRARVNGESGALVSLVTRVLDEEVRPLLSGPGGFESRLAAAESDTKNIKAQVEVAAQLQDRQHALTSAVEEQVSSQLAAARAAAQALRTDLGSKLEALAAGLGERVEVIEAVVKSHSSDLQVCNHSRVFSMDGFGWSGVQQGLGPHGGLGCHRVGPQHNQSTGACVVH